MQFGPDVTKRFCENNGLEAVIRSHEVRMDGYEVQHDGKCITGASFPFDRVVFVHVTVKLTVVLFSLLCSEVLRLNGEQGRLHQHRTRL